MAHRQPFTSLTLREVLALVGMRSEPGTLGTRLVIDAKGRRVGEFTPQAAWDHLKSTGLLHTARQEHGRQQRGLR